MSELQAVRCNGCGGAVAVRPGRRLPACLFCGDDASDLIPFEPPESVEDPVGAIPFAVEEEAARASFIDFARSSFFYPSDLRHATLDLRRLLLPAWAFSGVVETHWTGLVSASTRSGKRPVAGSQTLRFDQVLVPASKTLTVSELRQLGAFDEAALDAFDASRCEEPYELGEMTRSVARQAAQDEMARRHAAQLEQTNGLVKIRAASICTDLEGRPVLVPVYVGAYRYRDVLYRVLVQGQTGRLVGKAPVSLWKVLLVVLLVLLVIGGVTVAIMGCGGVVALFSSL